MALEGVPLNSHEFISKRVDQLTNERWKVTSSIQASEGSIEASQRLCHKDTGQFSILKGIVYDVNIYIYISLYKCFCDSDISTVLLLFILLLKNSVVTIVGTIRPLSPFLLLLL